MIFIQIKVDLKSNENYLSTVQVLRIQIRMDPELLPGSESIQQKVKERINKTVNSGLFVL